MLPLSLQMAAIHKLPDSCQQRLLRCIDQTLQLCTLHLFLNHACRFVRWHRLESKTKRNLRLSAIMTGASAYKQQQPVTTNYFTMVQTGAVQGGGRRGQLPNSDRGLQPDPSPRHCHGLPSCSPGERQPGHHPSQPFHHPLAAQACYPERLLERARGAGSACRSTSFLHAHVQATVHVHCREAA